MIYHLSYSLKNIFIMYPDREKALAKGRRKGKTFIRVFCGIFISVGIILLIVGIAVGVSGHTFRQKAEPTDAVILAMRGASSESFGTPVVEYTVDGKSYTAMLNMASSSMYPGKRITIYYQKNNPREVRYLDDNGWLILIFAFIGTVFTGIGMAFWLVKRSHERKARQLLATGEVVEAEITGIGEDTSSSMNGHHPIMVSCRYTAPDGRVYFFRSGSFWYESYEIAPKKKVRVYVDRNNPANYYVDVDSAVG